MRGRVKEPDERGDPEIQRMGFSDSLRRGARTPGCPASSAEGLTKAGDIHKLLRAPPASPTVNPPSIHDTS